MIEVRLKCKECGFEFGVKIGSKTAVCPYCKAEYIYKRRSKKYILAKHGEVKD